MAYVYNFTEFLPLNNFPCIARPTLIGLNDEYNQILQYYPFMVNLDRYVGSCNAFNNLLSRICLPRN